MLEKLSQGYKNIYRNLNVPVSTVHNTVKMFTSYGTVAILDVYEQEKYMKDCKEIAQRVDKESLLTFKQIEVDLQVQGTYSQADLFNAAKQYFNGFELCL